VKKTTDQVVRMRRAGRVVAEMHEAIRDAIRPGVTTARLDAIARDVLERRGAVSSFLGYHGFPAVICASPDDMVVHGIPNDLPLEEGALLSIDCGAIVDGWHGDAAFTAPVGAASAQALRLVEAAEASLSAAIARMVPGNRLSDVGHAVELVAAEAGFQVVRDYVGHGIGTAMHEDPDVPNFGPPGKGPELVPGVVLAVEPMLTVGSAETVVLDDGWSVVTADGSLAAHVEHTIAVTDHGPEILTLP